MHARDSKSESRCHADQRVKHRVVVSENRHEADAPVNSNSEIFTPSTETPEFCREMLNFSVGDSKCGTGTKYSGAITATRQLGNGGRPFGIVEFPHALVNELAYFAVADNTSKNFDLIHHPTSLMFVERLEVDADQNSATVNGVDHVKSDV